jgi:hypothetical protein
MTDGRLDLHDILAALGPHGWMRAQSFVGLCRMVTAPDGSETGLDVISPEGLGDRFTFSETWAGKSPLLHQWPDRKTGTAAEVLAHVLARYANETREAA